MPLVLVLSSFFFWTGARPGPLLSVHPPPPYLLVSLYPFVPQHPNTVSVSANDHGKYLELLSSSWQQQSPQYNGQLTFHFVFTGGPRLPSRHNNSHAKCSSQNCNSVFICIMATL